jgi:mRNA-degrading endonuclease RelE of RelBE toxin-antitoxin system
VYRVVLSDAAVRQLMRVPKGKRSLIKDGIREHLAKTDPLRASRNKFRLRRPSEHAEFELRVDPWRVFYRVRGNVVEVVLIGEKTGDKLVIEGEEFIL